MHTATPDRHTATPDQWGDNGGGGRGNNSTNYTSICNFLQRGYANMALTTFSICNFLQRGYANMAKCASTYVLQTHTLTTAEFWRYFLASVDKKGGWGRGREEGGEEGGKVNYLKSCHQQRLVCKTHTCRALPKQMREEHSFIPPSSPLFSSQHSRLMIVKSLSCVKKINRTAQGVFPHSTKENSRTWILCMGRSGVQAAQILVS